MTPKKKRVLRTAFNDVFQVGDVVVTQFGTEVPDADADGILAVAEANGVRLVEVEDDAHVADFFPTSTDADALAAAVASAGVEVKASKATEGSGN